MENESSNSTDLLLINKSLSGDKRALEDLVKKHQVWIFNVALNLTANAEEAADLMQEVLIKVITNLGKFEQRSSFRTWVYRILKNHFLNTKRSKYEKQVIPWDQYSHDLDAVKDEVLTDTYNIDKKLLIEEAKLSCMKAMLLCLSPEQRLVFVTGELFETPDSIASEMLEISKANFRKKLSRAREQLYNFMNNKCGLVNKSNPCRCARKTAGFIKKGYVDPENLQFQKDIISRIEQVVEQKTNSFQQEGLDEYRQLYQQHYYQQPTDKLESLKKLLSSEVLRDIFEW